MKLVYILALLASLFLLSCTTKPTLQKYFVEKSEDKDFVSLDVSPSILNMDPKKMTGEQQTALKSFEKINILAFKINSQNAAKYETESSKVSTLLKDKNYQELMKIGSGKDMASISFVGDENHINEFVLFGKRKENGFAVFRILGKDMNPNTILNMVSLLKNSNINAEQFKPLEGLLK
jgi:hypothetical protein